METILVGVDGSSTSRRALDWALAHASADDVVILAHAWTVPTAFGFEMPAAGIVDMEVAAHRLVADLVAELDVGGDGPKIATYVGSGRPGEMLADLSHSVDLVVVGSRGYGEVRGMLLGSVSSHVVHHAGCPAVVVPRVEIEEG